MLLPIVHYNDPILRKKGEKILTFDSALAELASDMIETMHEAEGIGLAAQQVGRALQLCVADLRASSADYSWELDGARPPRELFMPIVLCNPTVSVLEGTESDVFEEGCLSFPGIRGDVSRPSAITARYKDAQGVPHVLACDGLLARCILHEVDHVNGVLFLERMTAEARAKVDEAARALARQTREERKARGKSAATR
jgi:peptide deformylase